MYLIALSLYSYKTKCTMYLKSGILIIGYAILFLCRLVEDYLEIEYLGNEEETVLKIA